MEQYDKLVSDLISALSILEPDVVRRNTYMNTRDRYVYQSGLFEDLDIEGWFAEYNYLKRVVDIHTAQLMGRPFNVYSYYTKEDLTPYESDENQLKLAEMKNKKAKADADARKRTIAAIIRDNGGFAIYKEGARLGSVYGETNFKQWFDKKEQKIKQVLIESPQNMYHGWSDNNFRERDFDAYVHQISADKAYRDYGSKLPDGAMFDISREGSPFLSGSSSNNKTNDPINQFGHSTNKGQETDREMVTVIDFAGYLKGWAGDGKEAAKSVDRGKESRLGLLVVGGHLVQLVSNEKFIPKYYMIPNRVAPRRAIFESDIPQSAMDINKEIVQLESDSMTWANKSLFKKLQMKGFAPESVPKFKPRKTQAIAMAPEQSIEEVHTGLGELQSFRALIEAKIEAFVRVTNVGRVLFDDPSISANSNQALMTTMKPVIDIVEDKQSRWDPVLQEMFSDALKLSAEFIPELKDIVSVDEDWFLCIEWPSVLRREDNNYQAMWINRFNAGTVSLETYLEKMGDPDTGEEVNRIRDELKDPLTAAILGKQLGEIAHQAINKSLGIPPWGYVIPKVNLRGDLTPQQEANMAENYQWNQGPYGSSIGPQGAQGTAANDNFINAGQITGNPFDGGMPTHAQPSAGSQQGQPAPQLSTPDSNHIQPVSQPGSGAPSVTPGGAVAQNNQNNGH